MGPSSWPSGEARSDSQGLLAVPFGEMVGWVDLHNVSVDCFRFRSTSVSGVAGGEQ